MTRARQRKSANPVRCLEYARDGWTFHAKGAWCDHSDGMATVIGSSNYGALVVALEMCRGGGG